MLKFSTKSDYGLVFLLELSRNHGQKLVSLSDLSKRKRLSSNYLHQVIAPLREAGYVESREGARGGYRLRKSPAKITLLEVLETLEGPLALVQCQADNTCASTPCCDMRVVWNTVQQELKTSLQHKTLADLLQTNKSSLQNSNK